MARATLTSKGQVTIPKVVRDHLHLAEGDAVDFVMRDDGSVVLRPLVGSILDLSGLLRSPREPEGPEEADRRLSEDLGADDTLIRESWPSSGKSRERP